jgi:hypothetical protein
MGTIEGYIPFVDCKGVRYYYLSSSDMWTTNFLQISLADLNERKIEVRSLEFPEDSSTYSHTRITLSANTDY